MRWWVFNVIISILVPSRALGWMKDLEKDCSVIFFRSLDMDPFSYAIQPMVRILQLLGLNFSPCGSHTTRWSKWIFHLYSTLCLLVHVGWNIHFLVGFTVARLDSFHLTAELINWFIDVVNLFVGNVGSHLALFMLPFSHDWQEFWRFAKQLESALRHEKGYYDGLRIRSWMAAIFTISFVRDHFFLRHTHKKWLSLTQLDQNERQVALQLLIYWHQSYEGTDVSAITTDVLMNLAFLYPIGSYTFYCLLTWSIAGNFRRIDELLNSYLKRTKVMGNGSSGGGELARIRLIHGRTCLASDRLCSAFQWLSLIHVVFAFIGVINTSFILLTLPTYNLNIWLYQLESVARLWMIGTLSDNVHIQAIKCASRWTIFIANY